ncbi:MAG: hypothetical protein DWQ34_09170 [Planctomycetota bacterium]|nr:MAG: hypothetical protein DWQ29_24160 [Planctomycetota bacterium]REJ94236.1 MAG: hypothetical protein DWQ34_09170 [Planctomycetota bacterium]REK20216.1 MAG: hypothetical protein DWQ41_26105 [Planctomycetota bacterium]REK35330.1 MAG: hypothetical protein DWQ45_11415 [Planctomycetota bacterium]
MSECDQATSVPDWLIEHPEILPVLRDLGLDYSCGGKSLEFACAERGLDVNLVLTALREVVEANRRADSET